MITNLEKIKQVPIEDVIGRFVKLKRGIGLCPFHGEKTPSFHVYKKSNVFKCFGCGESGDAISFIEKHEHKDFFQAVETVAEIGNVPVEIEEGERDAYLKKKESKRNLHETLEWALKQYSLFLDQSEVGKAYADQRGFDEETVRKWNIGVAPDSFNYLTQQIIGISSPEHALAIGLIKEKEDKGTFYDAFRNRIIYPITNEYGHVISLTGRTIAPVTDYNPKNINGIISDLYSASTTLFGLYQAIQGIKEFGFAIVVEGPADVISMHQAGATNTVGKLGSFFTREQAALLKRYTDHVCFMPDIDRKKKDGKLVEGPAVIKAEDDIRTAMKCGFQKVEVFIIPHDILSDKSTDPDDFARNYQEEIPAAATSPAEEEELVEA